jgi:hypothetical protein
MRGMRIVLGVVSSLCLLAGPVAAETYHVAPGGDDGASGLEGAPWATLQHAADSVAAGDTVRVAAGEYQGFYLEARGADGALITFVADGDVRITSDNETTPDGFNLEGASFVRVEGFTVNGATRSHSTAPTRTAGGAS